MSTTQQAKRRRRQAAMGFAHLAPQQRPIYHKAAKDVAAKRLEELIAREKARQMRKGLKGKKT